jgi:hypothetical protein
MLIKGAREAPAKADIPVARGPSQRPARVARIGGCALGWAHSWVDALLGGKAPGMKARRATDIRLHKRWTVDCTRRAAAARPGLWSTPGKELTKKGNRVDHHWRGAKRPSLGSRRRPRRPVPASTQRGLSPDAAGRARPGLGGRQPDFHKVKWSPARGHAFADPRCGLPGSLWRN